MIYKFRGLISLKKLLRSLCSPVKLPSKRIFNPSCAGQIATIMILIIVALLIFILITLNITGVSSSVVMMANAVDSAGMLMGSMLASRSNQLYTQLGGHHKCARGGLLGVILGTLFALVAILTYQGYLVPMIAGAIGGALGNTIIYGNLQGALQGALMGAVIGLTMAAGQGAGHFIDTAIGNAAATSSTSLVVGYESFTVAGAAAASATTITGAELMGAAVGAIIADYNAYVMTMTDEGAVTNLLNRLNALPEFTSMRENLFFNALMLSVDDPTMVQDARDLDGDGDYGEDMPAFTYWFDDHTTQLKQSNSTLGEQVDEFIDTVLLPFYTALRIDFLPLLDRKEVECECSPAEARGINLLRLLLACGYDPVGWLPGPSRDALISYYCNENEDTPAPAGWDDIDELRYELEEFITWGRAVLRERMDECGIYFEYDPDELAKTLRAENCANGEWDWFDHLYCAGSNDDFASIFRQLDLQSGLDRLLNTRDRLPGCQLKWGVYEEKRIDREDPPLCQCPYPLETLEEAETNPGSVNICDEVFPCHWTDEATYACGTPDDDCGLMDICDEEPAGCLEGVHFPNPPCRVYGADYNQLNGQINFLRNFVNNLEDRIIDAYFCGGDPCTTGLHDTQFDPSTLPPFNPNRNLAVRPNACGPEFEICHVCPPSDGSVIPEPMTLSVRRITDTQIQLNWAVNDPEVNASRFNIYRNGVFLQWVGAASTSFTDYGVLGGQTYTYQVEAVDASGLPIPNVYATSNSAFSASVQPLSDTEISLSWTVNDGTAQVGGFEIYQDGVLIRTVGPGARSYTDTGLLADTDYTYDIVVLDEFGNPITTPGMGVVGLVGRTASDGYVPPECETEIDIDIDINKVCLYSTAHTPCSKEPLRKGEGRLLVQFDYRVVCDCCVGIAQDPLSPPEAEMEENVISGRAWGVICLPQAPDIDLNLVGLCAGSGDCLNQSEFLARLDDFSDYLTGLERAATECDPNEDDFATIDKDAEDEFAPVTNSFCDMITALDIFLAELPAWADIFDDPWEAPAIDTDPDCVSAQTSGINEDDGSGCLRYDWEDSHGAHSITAKTGPFKFAWIRKEKSGNFLVNKTCYILTDYCDNMAGCGDYKTMRPGSAWISIERVDTPTGDTVTDVPSTGTVDLGLKWYSATPTGRILRKAKAAYNYGFVGIGGIRD